MKYHYLGNSGLAVSTICLGTLTFGNTKWGCSVDDSYKILNEYVEQGGNFVDTADHYNDSLTEIIIGDWLKSKKREDLVIATKCGFPLTNNINDRGLSRSHIINACEQSLKRLNTDYIDLYQIYSYDPQTPLEETMEVLGLLIKQGKVRYIGCSNFPAWKVTKSYYISKIHENYQFISGQYLYNLLKRDVEIEVVPACEDAEISLVSWSPLSGGMLTGKYFEKVAPPKGSRLDIRQDLSKNRYQIWQENSLHVVKKLHEISKKYNLTPSIVALAWLLRNVSIASVAVGVKNVDQVIENIKASDWEIPTNDWNDLNKLSKINYGFPRYWCESKSENWFENIKNQL